MFRKIYKNAAAANDLKIKFTSATRTRGYIVLGNGKRLRFASNDPGLNSRGAIRLCKDKYRCGEMLEKAGVSVPKTVLIPGVGKKAGEDDEKHGSVKFLVNQSVRLLVEQVGYPLFVKPNTGSEGHGVFRADDAEALAKIVRRARKNADEVLVQQACIGEEYRVVVLDGKIIMAYQKVPMGLIGDGVSTIDTLLNRQLSELRKKRKLRLQAASPKIDFTLVGMGYTRESILEEGKLIYPVPSANLAQGAHPVDKTAMINEHFSDVCMAISKTLKIKFTGIDLMVHNNHKTYHVIEVNSRPGFGKYAGQSAEHKRHVAEVYEQCVYFANQTRAPVSGPVQETVSTKTLIPA